MTRLPLLFVALALTGCEQTTTTPASEVANPAATFCLSAGNRYEIRDGANGQYGVCILPDGSEVDAWDYFRANA